MTLEKIIKKGNREYIDGYLFGIEQVSFFPPFIKISHYQRPKHGFPRFLDAEHFDADEAGRAKGNEIFKELKAKGYKRVKD